jgi:hypothetical protein
VKLGRISPAFLFALPLCQSLIRVLLGVVACTGVLLAQGRGPSALIDTAALLEDVRRLAADDMEGRRTDTPGGARARAYVVQRFRASGIQPFGSGYEMPFAYSDGRGQSVRHGVNVVGRIVGSRDAGSYLVVSAHYDHLGVQGGAVYNGADDNASGTAALFALAKHFSTHRPAHSLIFAAFDAEEAGLRGSRAFLENPPVSRSSILMNVNIDMIGRDSRRILYVAGTFLNPFLKPLIERVAATAPVTLLAGHDNPGVRGVEDWTRDSDHWTFQAAGIPAIYLGVEDFEQHHKPTDDYETLTADFYIDAVETCLAVVNALDVNWMR